MKSNKKIIALICALSMIITMFANFSVSAATVGKGLLVSVDETNKDNTKVVLNVSYTGIDAMKSLSAYLTFDKTLLAETNPIVAENTTGFEVCEVGYRDDLGGIAISGAKKAGMSDSNKKITTITINLKEAATEDITLTFSNVIITDGSGNELSIEDNTLDNVNVIYHPYQAPTPTPEATPTPRPTSPVRPPQVTIEPTVEPTVEPTDTPSVVNKGIVVTLDKANSTSKKLVLDFTYVGIDAMKSLSAYLTIDKDLLAETDPIVAENTSGFEACEVGYRNDLGGIAISGAKKAGMSDSNKKITTITVNLKDEIANKISLTFSNVIITDGSGNELSIENDTLDNCILNVRPSDFIKPTAAPTATPIVKQVALKDNVGAGANEAIKDAQKDSKDVYISVDFKKNDGTAAKYGEDFVAVYDKKTLTEDEYNNLINGYTESDMSKVIDGLTFNIYNSDVTSISTTVNAIDSEGNAEQIVDPKDNTLTPAKPTAKPSEPSISVKASSTTVEFDKKFTVTATVKNAKDGAKVAFTTNDDEKYAVIFGTPTEINSKGETKATYVANDKPGTVTITATYKDTEGNEKSASVKVTVKKASTTTGGNDGTTSGGGPGIIAPGNTGAVTTPNTNTNYKPDFQDLDSVEWARTAINGLAMRGMINGRDQYTFDPNANITRAEYCQILMGAINALNAKGESTFADVPSTAWYYNAVSVASQLGIVSGYGDGNFGPNDLITRQDMALMTYKTAKIMNKSLEPVNAEITFEDSHEISDYAFEAVMTLQKAGIINGMTDTTFEPHSNATRAQSAKVIFDTFVDAQ